ncbi:hypothetical protein [Pseudoduganella rhizocola]|uniref:hypothetical protein n=1 Tax=Pseudoduganella rhizocola TaxID=3382643 RepID=UPI0038B599CB
MNERKHVWSGSDLSPLVYESLVSSVMRLAWRNALCRAQLCAGLSKYKVAFTVDTDLLREKTGWSFKPSELDLFEVAQKLEEARWRESSFRYCPICLEACYHSDLYQCRALTACPLHHVPLSITCYSCGAPTAKYGWSREMINRPYECSRCAQSVAGAQPSLEGHLDLRKDEDLLRRALEPYIRWWVEGKRSRGRVHQLRAEHCEGLQRQWCEIDDFLRAVASVGRSEPYYIRSSNYDPTSITVLRWKCRITDLRAARRDVGRRSWTERTRVPTSVYRCTLRMLARWVATRMGWGCISRFDDLFISAGRDVSSYPPELVALLGMRWQLEQRCSRYSLAKQWPLRTAELADEPSVDMALFHHRTPRVGWRAIFLAIYAAWYWRLRSGVSSIGDAMHFAIDAQADRAYIFCRNAVFTQTRGQWVTFVAPYADDGWFVGEVAFLGIDGLPLNGADVITYRRVAPSTTSGQQDF